MVRFRDILAIPATLKPQDPALRRALALAGDGSVRVTVGWPVEDAEGIANDILRQAALDSERAALEELVAQVARPGLDIQSSLVIGRPYMAIIHRVLTRDHDVVIKTARGRQLQQNLFFGSTALHLLRKCPCPVWVVDDQGPAQPGPVLAAIDPANSDPAAKGLATTIVDHAAFLARCDNVPLHVVHAWTVPHEETLRNSGFIRMSGEQIDAHVEGSRRKHTEAFQDVTGPFAGQAESHLVKGQPDAIIPDMIRDLGITTLVIGTVARGGVPGLLVGNTAENLLSQVRCSVLAIKPPGFVSPVAVAGA